MKVGYQDAGSWTIPVNVKGQPRAMAWLWAQFCVSKSVALKKFLKGGTPVRKSTVFSQVLDPIKYKWGGLIDFYRSPEEKKWTDTGLNNPHYPALSAVWWPNISRAINGQITPAEAMNAIAEAQDSLMSKMYLMTYSPRLNKPVDRKYWLNRPGSPKPERPKPKPLTIAYDDLVKRWQ